MQTQELTVFTTATCPKCKVLKTKLVEKGLSFKEETNIERMRERHILSVPQLLVGEKLLPFSEAVNYINKTPTL